VGDDCDATMPGALADVGVDPCDLVRDVGSAPRDVVASDWRAIVRRDPLRAAVAGKIERPDVEAALLKVDGPGPAADAIGN